MSNQEVLISGAFPSFCSIKQLGVQLNLYLQVSRKQVTSLQWTKLYFHANQEVWAPVSSTPRRSQFFLLYVLEPSKDSLHDGQETLSLGRQL